MKDLTEELQNGLNVMPEYILEQFNYEPEHRGEIVCVPDRVVKAMLEKMRSYEVESVDDLLKNFDMLSKQTRIPMIAQVYLKFVMFSNTFHDYLFGAPLDETGKKPIFYTEPGEKKDFDLLNVYYSKDTKYNFNQVKIENVHLDDLSFKESQYHLWLQFSVRDLTGKKIDAVFAYKDAVEMQGTGLEKKVELICSSSPITTFDLDFQAMRIPKNKLYPDGLQILKVTDVRKSDEDRDKTKIIPPSESIPEPNTPQYVRVT